MYAERRYSRHRRLDADKKLGRAANFDALTILARDTAGDDASIENLKDTMLSRFTRLATNCLSGFHQFSLKQSDHLIISAPSKQIQVLPIFVGVRE